MFLFKNTHCQKGLWRESARHSGVLSGVNFNVLGNPAELIRKLKFHADIAVFINLDMVYKFNQNFPVKCFNVLVFHKGYKSGMLIVNTVCQFRPFSGHTGGLR